MAGSLIPEPLQMKIPFLNKQGKSEGARRGKNTVDAHLHRVTAERTGSVDTDESESEGQGGMLQSNVVRMPPI